MTRPAAVGVDDDLATGQTAIADRAADHEVAGRVDVELGLLVDPLRRQHRLEDFLHHAFAQRLQLDARIMLGRQHDRVDRSEEHTSELQSLMRISYAVFCLKKQKNTTKK